MKVKDVRNYRIFVKFQDDEVEFILVLVGKSDIKKVRFVISSKGSFMFYLQE